MSVYTKQRKYVGQPVLRTEGHAKVTGAAVYVDDLQTPGAIYGKTIRTTVAAGTIKKIEFLPGVPWEEIIVVDVRDVPCNCVSLIDIDQPVFVDRVVRHREEPVLLLGHANPGFLEDAARLVRIEYDAEPGVFDIGAGEVMKEYLIEHHDPAPYFEKAEVIFEGVYETGAQEHVYIEPNGFVAWWDERGLTLRGSHQCPFYVQKAVRKALDLREDELNIIQEVTGGGFGGKEDFPSLVAIHAALLAKKASKPVRLMYNRAEDMASSTKRHPSRSRVRTACSLDGKLQALDFEFLLDGGAYVTLSPVVLSRGILHACGPYRWDAARIHGICYTTNSPPHGAFRGFGAPQSLFAMELHLNRLADHLGLDPAELRRKNFLHRGDEMPTGQILDEEPNLEHLLDRALELSGYREKRKAYGRAGNRGISLSAFMHGTGFTGSGESYLASVVELATRADGKVEILVSSTEIGQGTETVFRQICAEAANLNIDDVVFRQPETLAVPNSGPTVASRTCSIVGKLVEKAGEQLRARLGGMPVAEFVKLHGPLRGRGKYEAPPGLVWDDEHYRGSAYPAYSWSVDVAEVSLDQVTMAPALEGFWSTVDIGTVINPVLAAGQVQGGIAQGIGWALCEHVVLHEGIMANTQLTNYIIPTSADTPEIIVEFVENPFDHGAFGAKGVGELPMDGPAPAIVAAINQAAGQDHTHIPLLPEALLK